MQSPPRGPSVFKLRQSNDSRSGLERWLRAALVLAAYGVEAVVLTWPLVLHLRTHLPGDPGGDTGVYVWNLWIFRHELVAHAHLPFSTQHIFGLTGGTDFSLHNYTAVAGVLAFPLIGALGIVGAFNLVMMLVMALSGGATYLLGRQLGLSPLRAWIVGALFIGMPLLSARETAHLSLVITGALPLFLWMLLRVLDRPTMKGGAGIGAIVALATYSDAYFGIYCVLMGSLIVGWRFFQLEPRERNARRVWWARAVGTAAIIVAAIGALGLVSGVKSVEAGPLVVRGVNQPYAPALIAVVLGVISLWLNRRHSLRLVDREQLPALLRIGMVSVGTCLALLAPPLVGVAERYFTDRLPGTQILWRSSPRGVDLLAYLVPNPVHAFVGTWTGRWLLPPVEDAFPELIASCSLLVVAVVVMAALRRRLPALWVTFTAFFGLLSLGPFVHVGSVNTFIPGPWALLRYVPIVGMARSPSRFAILAALGLCLLFGFVLEQWLVRPTRRAVALVTVFLALVAIEIVPGPRLLFSAEVPDIYKFVTADGDEHGRLLELPTGIRDGTSSLGDFNARSAYFQTRHGRPMLGGYLSRVSDRRRQDNLRCPVMRAIYALSERGGHVDQALTQAAKDIAPTFLARSCVRYVMIDTQRASPALRQFAIDTLHLVMLHSDDRFELMVPENAPGCQE